MQASSHPKTGRKSPSILSDSLSYKFQIQQPPDSNSASLTQREYPALLRLHLPLLGSRNHHTPAPTPLLPDLITMTILFPEKTTVASWSFPEARMIHLQYSRSYDLLAQNSPVVSLKKKKQKKNYLTRMTLK